MTRQNRAHWRTVIEALGRQSEIEAPAVAVVLFALAGALSANTEVDFQEHVCKWSRVELARIIREQTQGTGDVQ